MIIVNDDLNDYEVELSSSIMKMYLQVALPEHFFPVKIVSSAKHYVLSGKILSPKFIFIAKNSDTRYFGSRRTRTLRCSDV